MLPFFSRPLAITTLIALPLLSQAADIPIEKGAPLGCEDRGEISVKAGGKFQGLFFSDGWLNSNAEHKFRRAIKKAGGNHGQLTRRREFQMENEKRGLERIEMDGVAWSCGERQTITRGTE